MITEHDIEPIPGLPAELPAGERLLLQCSPKPMTFAMETLRLPLVLLYFVALAAWRMYEVLAGGGAVIEALAAASAPLSLGVFALLILGGIGWWMASASIYTVTSRRVIMKVGAALSLSANLPLSLVDAVDVKRRPDGSGTVVLTMSRSQRVSWVLLWPHVRPWRYLYPQPAMRAVEDVDRLVNALTEALNVEPGAQSASATAVAPKQATAPTLAPVA